MDGFAGLLLKELDLRKDYLADKNVDTLYFGGGTPTLLRPSDLKIVIDRLKEDYRIGQDAEITIEANPDDLDQERLTEYLGMEINRISIGTQSFFDEHLRLMNRRHDAAQAVRAVEMAAECGFGNISIDLIYGIPGMTAGQWEHNLQVAAGLPVCHISAYHLTIEPGTPFGKMKKSGIFSEIPDEQSVQQYRMLLATLAANGFDQYEISNFARRGLVSRHNTKYWTGDSYIGLGPSAHSYDGNSRHWNPSSLKKYTEHVLEGRLPLGETIDPAMHRNEYVMTRLRTAAGITTQDFIARFGESAWTGLLHQAAKYLATGDLILENGCLRFDREAWFHSDGILSDLFLIR
jgi:oxygen-independent coproporphyrinogen-3 oxidase